VIDGAERQAGICLAFEKELERRQGETIEGLFGEAASPIRLLCVCLIVSGIIGLKLVTPH
jgi:hypothetical protein